MARTSDGRPLRLRTAMDELSRKCLAMDVGRRIASDDVLERLTELSVLMGAPAYVRSEDGPKFTARAVREWLERLGVHPVHRARESLGEWPNRLLQRQAAERTSEPGDVRHGSGGEGTV